MTATFSTILGAATSGSTGVAISATTGSPAAGDRRVVVMHTAGSTVTVPAGWTTHYQGAPVGTAANVVVASRIFQAGDGNVTFAPSTNSYYNLEIATIQAIDPTGTVQVSANAGVGATLTAPSLTPAVPNGALLGWYGPVFGSAANTSTYGTAPANFTFITTHRTTAAVGYNCATYYQNLTSTAATGNRSVTVSPSTAYWSAVEVFIPGDDNGVVPADAATAWITDW